jgi:L-fuconate dehydratase
VLCQHLTVGRTLSSITSAFGVWWNSLVSDGQLRWLGPEKGIIHMAVGALVNAVWDLWAKSENKPVWRLLFDLSPQHIVSLLDFRWVTDAITPEEALTMLTKMQTNRDERLQHLLQYGYRAYTTSAGWLGYSEQQIRDKCKAGVKEGWTHFKAKVGGDHALDVQRVRIMREEIGDRTLMLDANQRWDVSRAIECMKELSQFKPWFIEEPTCADDILGHLAIKNALKPYDVMVATGEVCHNRVMFKQFITSGAMDICQIDSCRVAGVNEIIMILLIAAKYQVPVIPHAGGVGLCEYVQHLAMFDYLGVSGKQNLIEFVDHLHQHFVHPVVIRNGAYMPPMAPGYSIQLFPQTLVDYTFPTGKEWISRISAQDSRCIVTPMYHREEAVARTAARTNGNVV